MGNHEHPCVVCGENTLSAFNFDCERRHNARQITSAIAEVTKYCRNNCGKNSPCDYHTRDITQLAALLVRRPAHEKESLNV